MTSRKYVLISAHHCAPGMGSEHAVGWNLVSQLARVHNIILVTQDNEYRASIEAGIEQLKADGCNVLAYFVRHGTSTDGRKNDLRLFYYLTYIAYQWRVYQLAKRLVSQHEIAAVHHLNIVGFREPGFLWMLGLPFIWGPVGGLVYTPWRLYAELPAKTKLFQTLRTVITWLQFHLSPRVRLAYKATQRPGGAFIAATADIGARFQRRWGGRCLWIPETGSHDAPVQPRDPPIRRSNEEVLRLLWVGALIDRKPLNMLLDAIAAVPRHASRLRLTVVGDGDSRARFEAHARQLGVRADFLGWRPHEETLTHFHNSDLFVLLSISDLTTNVVFEALGNGLPVLCLDHHGYSGIVTEACGIKVRVSDPNTMRQDITRILDELCSRPEVLTRLAKDAAPRAAQFSWKQNASAISELYAPLL